MNDSLWTWGEMLILGLLVGFLLGAYVERHYSPLNYDKPIEVIR